MDKIIWVVGYAHAEAFLDKAKSVGATGVAIRTDNDVRRAIELGHDRDLKVYGWRWPSALPDGCMNEAKKAVALFANGLDGYFADPEQHADSALNWDNGKLAALATQFSDMVADAAGGKDYGVTSHYLAKKNAPNLPWREFFKRATVLLPQSYWRSTMGPIGHADPADNFKVGTEQWVKAGGDKARIQPMAGELGVSKASEVAAYAKAARAAGVGAMHFYAYGPEVAASVWDAVSAA